MNGNKRLCGIVLAVLTAHGAFSQTAQSDHGDIPDTYYVNSESGDDQYAGTSPDSAWKSLDRVNQHNFLPGDSLLMAAGSEWTGQLVLTQSGTGESPITLGRYGTGPLPRINGGGAEGGVITLWNASHWKLSSLEITNPSETEGSRIGVLIKATTGSHGHIHLDSLKIHHIFGRYSFEMIGKNTGGIGIIGENDSRFDRILVENCEISDIVRVGIFTNGNRGSRGDRPITNLVIRNNTVSRCAGDGMIIRFAYRPLIEYNLAIENHNGPEEKVKWGVAIWVRSTDEAVIQYNRVFGTLGSMDGQAFDADLDAYRTLVQYNYSRDNEGGFMLVYGTSSDAIVRYNISQNDGAKGGHLLDFPVWESPRGSGIFHNNVFYIGEGIDAVLVDEALGSARVYNNIVINRSGAKLYVRSEGNTATFSHNCLVGYTDAEASVDAHRVEGDPLLKDPGKGASEFSSLDGYRILPGSSCLGNGLPLPEMEGSYWYKGEWADFWGNPVNPELPDVGAHQRSGTTGMEGTPASPAQTVHWRIDHGARMEDTRLRMELEESLNLRLDLFDLNGRWLDTLYAGNPGPGSHSLPLYLKKSSHLPDRAGAFLLRLTSPGKSWKDARLVVLH